MVLTHRYLSDQLQSQGVSKLRGEKDEYVLAFPTMFQGIEEKSKDIKAGLYIAYLKGGGPCPHCVRQSAEKGKKGKVIPQVQRIAQELYRLIKPQHFKPPI